MTAVDLDQMDVEGSGDRPVPYRADGGYTVAGGMMLIGLLGFAGMLLGILASVISKWFYLIVLFPMAIGLGVGGVGAFGIRRFQIRTPLLCGLAGFCGGVFAMLAMHYTDFRREMTFRGDHFTAHEIEVAARVEEIKNDPNASADDKALGKELRGEPLVLKMLQVRTFWDYMDYAAERGVELKRTGRGRGLNLGHAGSYIYWGVEVLIVAGVAFGIMKSTAEDPFCAICETWKVEQEFPGVGGAPQELAAALSAGNLARVQQHLAEEGATSLVNLWVCPNCEEDAPFEAGVKELVTNAKGEVSKKPRCLVTFPGESLAEVRGIVFPYAAAAAFESWEESAVGTTPTAPASEPESA